MLLNLTLGCQPYRYVLVKCFVEDDSTGVDHDNKLSHIAFLLILLLDQFQGSSGDVDILAVV